MLSAIAVQDILIENLRFELLYKYTILIVYDPAQSATQKCTTLGIESFWEKPSSAHPLKREKFQVHGKLAILAKENIALDVSFGPKPENVQLPLEPVFESTIIGSSAQLKREQRARIAQLEMNCENCC